MKHKRIIAAILVCTIFISGCTPSLNQESTMKGEEVSAVSVEEIVEETAEGTIEETPEESEGVTVQEKSADFEQEVSPEISAENVAYVDDVEIESVSQTDIQVGGEERIIPEFYGLNDPELLGYIEDKIYSDLDYQIDGDKYTVESISVVYISQEYLDEIAYNSKNNIYFGYSLEDVEKQFSGEKYIFTLENGETVVKAFENYDDTFNQVVKNVAIGTGVILVCVVISTATAGTATGIVFAAAAKTGAEFAISSAIISGASKAVITGMETKDINQALKAAALEGSESFKWGAIAGCTIGGTSKALELYKSATTLPTWQEAEKHALDKYGGEMQVSFKDGERLAEYSNGSTRPDIIREVNGHGEAIEVKRYDLENNLSELKRVLNKQVSDRMTDLPADYTQRIALDVRGRGYSTEFTNGVVNELKDSLSAVYENIPIDIIAY